jgi:2-C-methyl-D-erythritol 4-phosphate cytidylyltransferase
MMPELEKFLQPDQVTVVILAAGSGVRLGNVSKARLNVENQSYLESVLCSFQPFVRTSIVCLNTNDMKDIPGQYDDPSIKFVEGGNTRQDTVAIGMAQVDTEFTILHDVARPLCSSNLIKKLLLKAADKGAAVPALKLETRDSLATIKDGQLINPLHRDQVVSVQTPLVFKTDQLRSVMQQAIENNWHETGIISLFLKAGIPVSAVDGERQNLKVTYPGDKELIKKLSVSEN